MIPVRAYKIRPRTFNVISSPPMFAPRIGEVRTLDCALCSFGHKRWQKASDRLAEDVADLVEQCRQHEISEHSRMVTWEQFCTGYRVAHAPSFSEMLQAASAEIAWRHEHRDYEWLAEYPGTNDLPVTVTVRDPDPLLRWETLYAPQVAEETGRLKQADQAGYFPGLPAEDRGTASAPAAKP